MPAKQNTGSEEYTYIEGLRVGIYVLLLGFVYKKFFFDLEICMSSLILSLFVTFYLLVDGITRLNSRARIRLDKIRTNKPVSFSWELAWLICEIFGLVLFTSLTYHAYNPKPNFTLKLILSSNQFVVLFALFCVIAAIQNALYIHIDEGVSFGKFLLLSLGRDASEIKQVSNKWSGYLVEYKNNALKELKKAKEEFHQESDKEKGERPDTIIPWGSLQKILQLIKEVILKTTSLGILHGLVQFNALHVLILNLLGGIALFLPRFSQLILPAENYYLLSLPLLLCVISYAVTSYMEMERYQPEASEDQLLPEKIVEKVSQFLGNLFLLAFFFIIFTWLPIFSLVLFILFEQMSVGVLLLCISKPVIIRKLV